MAEHTKRDKLAADAEAKAGKKHRGLRMTVAGDKDEAKMNPRSLLKKVRKVLLDASPVLRKNPSDLVVKAFKVGDDEEEMPIFREWNDKLAAEEAVAKAAGRQALSLQATAGSNIVVSYDIVAPSATDVDAAVKEVSGSIGAAAVTPREASEGHGAKDEHDGSDEGVTHYSPPPARHCAVALYFRCGKLSASLDSALVVYGGEVYLSRLRVYHS